MSDTEINCSIVHTLEILGKKWVPFIIAELMIMNKSLSFTDLRQNLIGNYGTNISSRVLSDKLSILEKFNIVHRQELRHGGVLYSLTERGSDFKVIFASLKSWAIKHGGLAYESCKNQTCIHKTVDFFDFDHMITLLDMK